MRVEEQVEGGKWRLYKIVCGGVCGVVVELCRLVSLHEFVRIDAGVGLNGVKLLN
jgi:hypothetical protein